MAVDGISAPLMLLTSLIIFAGSCISYDMNTRTKEFFVFLMILVCGVYGVFASQNLLFYIFFELALVPMYTLVGVWGSVRKDYAAMKLVLYLLMAPCSSSLGSFPCISTARAQTASATSPLNMDELATVAYGTDFQIFAYAFLAFGFGFLVKMFPFHTWFHSVTQQRLPPFPCSMPALSSSLVRAVLSAALLASSQKGHSSGHQSSACFA